jgi:hypothetical protein
LGSSAVSNLVPRIAATICTRARNTRTAKATLTYNHWKTDISGEISAEEARQISLLYLRLMFVDLQKELEDSFTLPYSPDGPYSTISTYNMLWEGTQRFVAADCIWKSRTPLKCQIFMWLAVKHII